MNKNHTIPCHTTIKIFQTEKWQFRNLEYDLKNVMLIKWHSATNPMFSQPSLLWIATSKFLEFSFWILTLLNNTKFQMGQHRQLEFLIFVVFNLISFFFNLKYPSSQNLIPICKSTVTVICNSNFTVIFNSCILVIHTWDWSWHWCKQTHGTTDFGWSDVTSAAVPCTPRAGHEGDTTP